MTEEDRPTKTEPIIDFKTIVDQETVISGVLMKVGMPMLGCGPKSRFKVTRREMEKMLPAVQQLAHVKRVWIKDVETGDELWISMNASQSVADMLRGSLDKHPALAKAFSIGTKQKED